jgi:hypothetical protein
VSAPVFLAGRPSNVSGRTTSADAAIRGFKEEQIPKTGLPWFSCLVPSANEDQPSRPVTGWFSGELVWMLDGSSPAVVQDLMNELAMNATSDTLA